VPDPTPALLQALARTGLIESAFDTLPDVVFFVKDVDARYRVVNRTLVERCGRREKAELLGLSAAQVFPAPLGERYLAQDREVLRGHAIRGALELHLLGPRRRGWCLTHKLPLFDERTRVIGMAGISRDLPHPDARGSGYRQVARAVALLRRVDRPLRTSTLARRAGLHPRRLERLLRRVFQLTPGQLRTQARVDAACRLLSEGGSSVTTIAQACGYADHSAFTRQFRATVGLTPSAFRRTRQGAAEGTGPRARRRPA